MNKIYFMMAAAAFIFAGCAKTEIQPDWTTENAPLETKDVTFLSSLPGVSVKTTLGNEVGHKSVSWAGGDQVRVFYANAHTDATVAEDGSINAQVGESEIYGAVYPLLDGSMSDRTITVTIPTEQDGTFAKANVMAAITGASQRMFAFSNVSGLISFEVKREDLTKVVIRSNDGSPIAGSQSLTFDENGAVSGVEYAEGGSPEITVSLNGPGTYYVATMMDVDMKAGFGMRFFKGEEPLSGVLSTAEMSMDPNLLQPVGTPEDRISEGDYYIKAGAEGLGTSWDNPGGEDLLRSLLNTNVAEGAVMDGVTLGWRLDGKTIHVAAGQYNINKIGAPVKLSGLSGLNFTLKGGYPDNITSQQSVEPDPVANETRLTVTSGGIFDFDELSEAEVEIDGFFFYKGASEGNGGAVNCDITGSLTFNRCTFRECTSTLAGGAINVASGNVHFNNCLFDQNESGHGDPEWKLACSGGAIAAASADSHVYLQLCTFKNNMAHSAADLYVNVGAKAYVNRSIFYGGYIIQNHNKTHYFGCSILADEGADKVASMLCINNSTVTESTNHSSYVTSGGLPAITLLSSKSLICNTTVIDSGMNLVAARVRSTKNGLEFFAYNNLLLNQNLQAPSINLDNNATKNAYFNVVCMEKNNWKLDENDIKFGYADFAVDAWDWNKGYYTWTLKEGKEWPEALAVKETLSQKVQTDMPDFDAWLKTVEKDPYGIDQSGAARNPLRMTPGAWECSTL